MVNKGRFTVALVNADTKATFKEHTRHGEIYVEVEPEAEYFIRIEVGAGATGKAAVVAKMFVDDASLGYDIVFKGQAEKETASAGLWSYDGASSMTTALMFARSKFFTSQINSSNQSSTTPLPWTGEVQVEFFEMIDTGESCVEAASESDWKGGDVGIVLDQAAPELKRIHGTMTLEGNQHTRTKKDDGIRTKYTEGRLIEILTLRYCSTKGMVLAGLFGPRKGDPYLLARKWNEYEHGSDAVVADIESMLPPPQKIQIGCRDRRPPKEYDLFDLSTDD
jgi:hypothetical protein